MGAKEESNEIHSARVDCSALDRSNTCCSSENYAGTPQTGGEKRNYYLLVPEQTEGKPAPLIVTLNGSNRDGKILLEHWKGLAREEGIILAGPDAAERTGWNVQTDRPGFLYALVEAIKSQHPVEDRRVYLFGHSAGAIHGLHTQEDSFGDLGRHQRSSVPAEGGSEHA